MIPSNALRNCVNRSEGNSKIPSEIAQILCINTRQTVANRTNLVSVKASFHSSILTRNLLHLQRFTVLLNHAFISIRPSLNDHFRFLVMERLRLIFGQTNSARCSIEKLERFALTDKLDIRNRLGFLCFFFRHIFSKASAPESVIAV